MSAARRTTYVGLGLVMVMTVASYVMAGVFVFQDVTASQGDEYRGLATFVAVLIVVGGTVLGATALGALLLLRRGRRAGWVVAAVLGAVVMLGAGDLVMLVPQLSLLTRLVGLVLLVAAVVGWWSSRADRTALPQVSAR